MDSAAANDVQGLPGRRSPEPGRPALLDRSRRSPVRGDALIAAGMLRCRPCRSNLSTRCLVSGRRHRWRA